MNDGFRIEPVTATIGARVHGLDVAALDEAAVSKLREALLEHHVLFIAAQELTDDQHRALAEVFGTPHPHPVAEWLGATDVIAYVTNDADNPPLDDSTFHTDYTFSDEIAAVAVLQAQVVPACGGDTIWANAHAAYDALSRSFREYLQTLEAYHTLGPKFAEVMRRRYGDEIAAKVGDRFDGAVHPVVVEHPVNGRPALFVNPGYTEFIVGLKAAESDALLRYLFGHLASPAFLCRHHWQRNEIAIWDEFSTLHQGPDDFWPHTRVLRRVTAGSVAPQPAAAVSA